MEGINCSAKKKDKMSKIMLQLEAILKQIEAFCKHYNFSFRILKSIKSKAYFESIKLRESNYRCRHHWECLIFSESDIFYSEQFGVELPCIVQFVLW